MHFIYFMPARPKNRKILKRISIQSDNCGPSLQTNRKIDLPDSRTLAKDPKKTVRRHAMPSFFVIVLSTRKIADALKFIKN